MQYDTSVMHVMAAQRAKCQRLKLRMSFYITTYHSIFYCLTYGTLMLEPYSPRKKKVKKIRSKALYSIRIHDTLYPYDQIKHLRCVLNEPMRLQKSTYYKIQQICGRERKNVCEYLDYSMCFICTFEKCIQD